MEKIITFSLKDNFIESLADIITDGDIPLGSLAFVFGGRRPALFLKKEIARRRTCAYLSAGFFSIDEFVDFALSKVELYSALSDMDACFIIYSLLRENDPEILRGRQSFAQFLPWAKEIVAFIEQLDLELVASANIKGIEELAAIGYDVPESINKLLSRIISLRQDYHRVMREKRLFSRGFRYMSAAGQMNELPLEDFRRIYFCGLFSLPASERAIVKNLLKRDKAVLVVQGGGQWQALGELIREVAPKVEVSQQSESTDYKLEVYSGFDMHSQVCIARDVLKTITDKANTLIVVPNPDMLIPLLSEISDLAGDFNVSMGYPLNRTPFFTVIEDIAKASLTKKSGAYYTHDYLRVINNPLVKNLISVKNNPAITRILMHKIEELMLGIEDAPLSGSLFIRLEDVENSRQLYDLAGATMKSMDLEVSQDELKVIVGSIHQLFFYQWEEVADFSGFACALEKLLFALVADSPIKGYPLNLKVIERVYAITDELAGALFVKEGFTSDEIFRIFLHMLEHEAVSFSGSPLKGLQILGFLETRSLNFKNVIILDVNEGVMPALRIHEPLIPRQAMVRLGLNTLEREEEVQRYLFMRLLSSARQVHLIYEDSVKKERSRFIEELLWQEQSKQGSLQAVPIPKAVFSVQIETGSDSAGKTSQAIDFLKGLTYSATSLNTYLHCPLKFYYHYVLGLREKEALLDGPEGVDIGIFIHSLLEETFMVFKGKKPLIDAGFKERFFSAFERMFDQEFGRRLKSDAFLIRQIMRYRLERFLENEAQRPVEEIVALEETAFGRISALGLSFRLQAKIDRIDRLSDGSFLVVDYKTGSGSLPQRLFGLDPDALSREYIRDKIKSFQLPLYIYLLSGRLKGEEINACLYTIRDLEKNSGIARLFEKPEHFEKKDLIMSVYMRALGFVLQEIISPDKEFPADKSRPQLCEYCDFQGMCR